MAHHPDWFEALADRYRIEEEIGRGGMACVYRAEDLRYHRMVAIKVLREDLAHAVALDRFQEEIRTAAKLNHPNIVPLYDSGLLPATPARPALPWFAMMYVEGETLRERLARGPLPVAEAVDLTRAVAAGLDYAHEHGVVHRDIKPANILLAGDVPVVADFGIARALDRARMDDTLTAPGLAVGTAQYISPEQAGAERTVDHRTDVYALGCVAYEMLAGHPPFTGPSPQAIINRHNLDPPPPLATVRPSVPPAAVAAVEKALAKRPADRWPSAGAFAHALRETTEHPARVLPARAGWRSWGLRRRAAAAGAAVLAVSLVLWSIRDDGGGATRGRLQPDAGRYVVFPLSSTDTTISQNVQAQLIEAIADWGVVVVPALELRTRVGGGSTPPRPGDGPAIARALEAGRYVEGAALTRADSVQVSVVMFSSITGRALHRATTTISRGLGNATSAIRALADSLLVPGGPGPDDDGPTPWGRERIGTRSLTAWQAFSDGVESIRHWNLAEAEAAFDSAWRSDPTFPQAALWVALMRSWVGRPVPTWRAAAIRAAADSTLLSNRDRSIARALSARASGDFEAACDEWKVLSRSRPRDYAAWYGLGNCLFGDDGVLPDQRSQSGYRFRSSRNAALRAYRSSYVLLPTIHRDLGRERFEWVRRLFHTQSNLWRLGRGVGSDRGTYLARPDWSGDSLALVPYPASPTTSRSIPLPTASAEAIYRQRQLFHQVAEEWVAALPDDPAALEAKAIALDLLGDSGGALDAIQQALSIASKDQERWALSATRAWLILKRALPDDSVGLSTARRLADSLSQPARSTTARDPVAAAALASLIGKAHRAAALLREPEALARWEVPPPLAGAAPALLVHSAFGVPRESLVALEGSVARAIATRIPEGERASARLRWLARAVSLSYPEFRSSLLPSLAGQGDFVVDALAALESGDSGAATAILNEQASRRHSLGRAGVTLDVLPVLASLEGATGHADRALELLDQSLADLDDVGPGGLEDPIRAASLGRAMLLRARLLAGRNPTESRRWRRGVEILWANGDSGVQSLLSQSALGGHPP